MIQRYAILVQRHNLTLADRAWVFPPGPEPSYGARNVASCYCEGEGAIERASEIARALNSLHGIEVSEEEAALRWELT